MAAVVGATSIPQPTQPRLASDEVAWPMDWVASFYEQQAHLFEDMSGITDHHRGKASLIERMAGPGRKRVLELGAGRGECAAAATDLGHEVVAVELTPTCAGAASLLASQRPGLTVVHGDFYEVDLEGLFDVVAYWDGFGVGDDDDQRRLLARIRGWLKPGGCALIDVYNPLAAIRWVGRTMSFGSTRRRYDFDPEGCRWLDTIWREGDEERAITQTLRCYTPADLRLLLEGTGLAIDGVEAGGGWDWQTDTWRPDADLHVSIWFTARLVSADQE